MSVCSYPYGKMLIPAAGMDMIGDEKFKLEWLTCYLETHPQYQGQEITQQLMDKWMDGLHKAFYVSTCHICTISDITILGHLLHIDEIAS